MVKDESGCTKALSGNSIVEDKERTRNLSRVSPTEIRSNTPVPPQNIRLGRYLFTNLYGKLSPCTGVQNVRLCSSYALLHSSIYQHFQKRIIVET